jgi:hypothetical protein
MISHKDHDGTHRCLLDELRRSSFLVLRTHHAREKTHAQKKKKKDPSTLPSQPPSCGSPPFMIAHVVSAMGVDFEADLRRPLSRIDRDALVKMRCWCRAERQSSGAGTAQASFCILLHRALHACHGHCSRLFTADRCCAHAHACAVRALFRPLPVSHDHG